MKRIIILSLTVLLFVLSSFNGCTVRSEYGLDTNIRSQVSNVIEGYCSALESHDIEKFGKFVKEDIKRTYEKFKNKIMDTIVECKVVSIDFDNAKYDNVNCPQKIQVLVYYTLKHNKDYSGPRDKKETQITEVFSLSKSKDSFIITENISPYTMVPPWNMTSE